MINITISGNYARVFPFTNTLADLCTNKRSIQDRQERISYIQEEPMFKEIKNKDYKTAIVYAGLVPRIKQYCETNNIEYKIVDKRKAPPKVDFKRIKGKLRFAQPESIAAVVSSHSGQIKLPTANGKTHVIGLLTELYRETSKVLIISEQASVLRTILDRCKELSKGYGYILNKDTDFRPKSDYIVCSTKSLHKVDSKWPDVIFYDEVHGAGAPAISQGLAAFNNTRMFGFTATPFGRSDNSELVIEALFGPVILNITYEQSQKAGVICPIKVFMIPVMGGGGDANTKKTDTARDRQGIWRNRIRNGVIQDVIRAIPETEQVLIMTNTAEHVFRLRKYLPDFAVAHGGLTDKRWNQFIKYKLVDPSETHLKNPKIKELENKFRNKEVRGIISTNIWKEGTDFSDLGILCRCDGKRGAIPSVQIGGRLSRKGSKGQKKFAVLLDFYDEFGKTFIGRTKDRIKFYKKEGWEVIEGWPDFNKLITDMYVGDGR